jgi:hypothetical protein
VSEKAESSAIGQIKLHFLTPFYIDLLARDDEHLVIEGPRHNLLYLEPIFLVPMIGYGDAIQSPGLYLSYYPSDNFLGGRPKEGSLTTMGMQIQLQLNLSFPLKLW